MLKVKLEQRATADRDSRKQRDNTAAQKTGGAGYAFSKENEIEYLRDQVEQLEKQVNCPQCNERPKQRCLPCGHLFCSACVQSQVAARWRNCPICRARFSGKDAAIKVYLENN